MKYDTHKDQFGQFYCHDSADYWDVSSGFSIPPGSGARQASLKLDHFSAGGELVWQRVISRT